VTGRAVSKWRASGRQSLARKTRSRSPPLSTKKSSPALVLVLVLVLVLMISGGRKRKRKWMRVSE
jgi:hypothetical protein